MDEIGLAKVATRILPIRLQRRARSRNMSCVRSKSDFPPLHRPCVRLNEGMHLLDVSTGLGYAQAWIQCRLYPERILTCSSLTSTYSRG